MSTDQCRQANLHASNIAGYDLQQVEVVLGQIDDVIKNITSNTDGTDIKIEIEMQKILHSNNSLIQEIVSIYDRLQGFETGTEDPEKQNQLFVMIVEKIRKLNEDLHLVFQQYRKNTPVTEQKR